MSDTAKGIFALAWCGLDIAAFCFVLWKWGGRK